MTTTKIPLWDGQTVECVACDTTYGVFETHQCQPQARCQSCFQPARLYDALNTHICGKCLAIIAKSILDAGLADAIIKQERERIAAWFSRAIVPTGIKSNHDVFRQDLYEFTEAGDEEIIDIDSTMQNIAAAIRSGKI